MAAERTSISFTVGSRHLLSVPRRLVPLRYSLEDLVAGRAPGLQSSLEDSDGVRVLSAPTEAVPAIAARFPGHAIGGRRDYRRYYIDMAGSYEDYLARFSAKTRSTLRRKQRKLAKEAGGTYTVTEHRTPSEIAAFLADALPLSDLTYQARLLDAGLPGDQDARERMMESAAEDRMRCYLLRAGDRAIAYLSLPVEGETLVYAHLGYDPAWSRLSPGTVLQMEALERLFAEQRFRWFDFTEGEGAHKAMFGTDSIACTSFLLLKPGAGNRILLGSLAAFDASVAAIRRVAKRSGALAQARKLLRA